MTELERVEFIVVRLLSRLAQGVLVAASRGAVSTELQRLGVRAMDLASHVCEYALAGYEADERLTQVAFAANVLERAIRSKELEPIQRPRSAPTPEEVSGLIGAITDIRGSMVQRRISEVRSAR